MRYRFLKTLLTGSVWLLAGFFVPVGAVEILPGNTSISRDIGGVTLTLGLSHETPFRVYTLDDPRRLLIDLGETDLAALPAGLAARVPEIAAMRSGLFQLGESRIVLDLAQPMVVHAARAITGTQGKPAISIRLAKASAAKFSAQSQAADSLWQAPPPPEYGESTLPLIAIDPGHGGIDFGAEQGEIMEKDITLQMAFALRETLLESGNFRVLLTRETDVFVPLGERVEVARRAGASAFISLHADIVTRGQARGTTVFSLSEAGEDQQAVTIATLENRADLVAGISVEGEDDLITKVLLQMAHRETDALSNRFADIVAESLWFQNDEEIKSRRMAAGFRVLRAPEIPSVLVEIGFMSDPDDLENMQDPAWQQAMADTLRSALERWQGAEAEMRGLLRN